MTLKDGIVLRTLTGGDTMNKKLKYALNIQYFAETGAGTETVETGAQQTNGGDSNPQGEQGTAQPKTFSQEEVDNIIQGRIAKERKSWEKQLEEKQTEAQKLEKMSAKEQQKYQEEKRIKELDEREKAITRRELTAQAKLQLSDEGIPTELAEILVFTDADSCKKSIEVVKGAFQKAVEKAVNERIKGGGTPKKAPNSADTEADVIYKMMMRK